MAFLGVEGVDAFRTGSETPRTGILLGHLLASLRDAVGADEVRARLFPAATQFFGALRGALFLRAEAPDDPRFANNPFARALSKRPAPLHDGQLADGEGWRAQRMRADHGHALVGPIVARGELIGVLGFTRHVEGEPFDADDVANLSALCLHVSTLLASAPLPAPFALTPRERDIVALVAQGRTNAQIGRALWVSGETVKGALKTLFRKAGVSSRAQLVAVMAGRAAT